MEDVPIVIGNEKIKTKDVRYQVMVRNYFILNNCNINLNLIFIIFIGISNYSAF